MTKKLTLMTLFLMLCLLGTHAMADETLQQARLSIPDMVCMSCEIRVEQAVSAVSGVAGIVFDGDANIATIAFDPGQTSIEVILAACEAAGYPATVVDSTEV